MRHNTMSSGFGRFQETRLRLAVSFFVRDPVPCRRPSAAAKMRATGGVESPMPLRVFSSLFLLLAVALACGCKPRPPAELEGAASEPATAVRQLVQHVHDNDLAGFARDALPPAELATLETGWREGRTRWPLTELPLDNQLLPMLKALSEPGAERKLQRDFDRQFANQGRDLRDAARSLGLFGTKYVLQQDEYSEDERKHYPQVIAALSAWAQDAPLGDPKRARAAIPPLCAAARRTGLDSDAALGEAGLTGSLQRLGPFFAQVKRTAAGYGLDIDRSLADLRTGLVEQNGDRATVRVHYPLAEAEVDAVVHLQRRDGRWYLAAYLAEADRVAASEAPAALLPAEPAPAAEQPQATPTPPSQPD